MKGKPNSINEIQFKIRQDIDSRVLVSLEDFLKYEEVIKLGINKSNVNEYLTCTPLLLIYNPHSKSSPIQLCADPSSKNKKGASINDTILPGNAHLQPITTNLLKAHFAVVHTTGDISNFYLQSGLNIQNSLNSAIYLQEPDKGTIYLTLDPTKNKNLKIYIYVSCKFGWTDTGNLANLTKGALTDIYEKYFPNWEK